MPERKHLLGRIPSPPDARDFRLENFIGLGTTGGGTDADLAALALSELKQTTISYPKWAAKQYADVTLTHWWRVLNALSLIAPPPPGQTWMDPQAVLDQGQYGTCVGNGWAQWGNTLPVGDSFAEKDARAIYYEATVIDGSPDDPDSPGGGQQGATVRAGVKAMQNRKKLAQYAFAATLGAVDLWLEAKGPVVIGSDWMEDMFNPDAQGFVKPTGAIAGGHCYLLLGYSATSYTFLNSWGTSWGLQGYFKMLKTDLEDLLAQGGEACVAVELAL